ncbi:hypothetical protein CR513_44264, partial [Mucuna pruriens]
MALNGLVAELCEDHNFTMIPVINQTANTHRHTSPEGILVFCLTRAPAATMAFFSTITPSSSIAPIPTKASSSTVQPCKTAL